MRPSHTLALIYHIAAILAVVQFTSSSGCPTPISTGFIVSARIVAALNNGLVSLSQQQDKLCYNYSLPYILSRPPEVAIGVHDFQLQQSKSIYYYIKTIQSSSYSSIPFVIRTQWSYTLWKQITFTFLAEDRTDIESGYYQVDAGLLSGCGVQKQIYVLLPFRNSFSIRSEIKHLVFLHGFELDTLLYQPPYRRSPFQLQLMQTSTNVSGIAVTIGVTTQTQIDSIYISYVAIQNAKFKYEIGSYVYNTNDDANTYIGYSPLVPIGRNYARLYGITGFTINYEHSALKFETVWDGFTFKFNFGNFSRNVQYYSFMYIFFMGNQCDQCMGYPLYYDGNCVNECPPTTILTDENICVFCGENRVWNGTACVIACPRGQYLNYTSNLCECPPSLNWNGQSCIICTGGKIFDRQSRSCECPNRLRWNGHACAAAPQCTLGRTWDVYTYSCICPQLKYWNGTQCATIPVCRGGQALQVINGQYQCACQNGYVWNGQICNYSPCLGGQLWTGTSCTCPIGLNYNGTMCMECINGQKWNKLKMKCECESGYKWNGQLCERTYDCAQGNRVWNQTYKQCICPMGTYWSGYTCIVMPNCNNGQYFDANALKCTCFSQSKWNGRECVLCKNGRLWNVSTLSCSCPFGTTQINGSCAFTQNCKGGKVWVHSLKSCQCPASSVWNGNYCINNPCSNGRIWSEQFQSCTCPNSNVYINESCIPPMISCTNGKVWNNHIYACECPIGTFNNQVRCDKVPECGNGKIYNPVTNECNCPYGSVESYFQCADPMCKPGQYFNGVQCQIISCPPPSYFSPKHNRCIFGPSSQNCQFAHYWNGQRCVYYPGKCPLGTQWTNQYCMSNGTCGNGFYLSNGECVSLPQQCVPPLVWDGRTCSTNFNPNYVNGNAMKNICPNGTYYSINKCIPFTSCKNDYVWDPIYMKCMCPSGTIDNGKSCVRCNNVQEWQNGVGCACPEGTYDSGSACEPIAQNRCQMIINAFWSKALNKCICRPGFSKIGLQCVCQGTQIGDLCDRCSYKPNSEYVSQINTCQCKRGYVQMRGICLPISSSSIGIDNANSCTVSTYFDKNIKMCVPCPDGCLSCIDCNRCRLCRPQFLFDVASEKCIQFCGDGKRFKYQCDDGNNIDGDGCTRDCKIQPGYSCSGGSPQSRDLCYLANIREISFQPVGQIRLQQSIVLNVKANYIPQSLILSSQCASDCNSILGASITSGDNTTVSINSKYIPGSNYMFTITIQFGRQYIGQFEVQIGINQSQNARIFGTISTSRILKVNVNPSYLSIVNSLERLS